MKRPVRSIISGQAGDVVARATCLLMTVFLAIILAPASFGLVNVSLPVPCGADALLSGGGAPRDEPRFLHERLV
jgi:hypothetical protein